MTRSNKNPKYFALYSKYDSMSYEHNVCATPAWERWYQANVNCSDQICCHPSKAWSIAPRSLDVEVVGESPASIITPNAWAPVELLREDLRDLLAPYMPGVVWGDCRFVGSSHRVLPRYFTIQAPRSQFVHDRRSKGNFYRQCPECMLVTTLSFGSGSLLLEKALNGRPVVLNENNHLFIEEALAQRLKLPEKIDDVRLLRIPVGRAPRDGWTLPGDDGWTGILVTPPECQDILHRWWAIGEQAEIEAGEDEQIGS